MSNNIFSKPKNAQYVNQISSVSTEKNIDAKDNIYVSTVHSNIESLKDDNNIFTKSKEALYVNDAYQGGRTDTATVTISKDKIIYVDIDNEYIYLESYLEDHIYYC